MKETWKEIPKTNGRYHVSSKGRIKTVDKITKVLSKYGEYYYRRFPGKVLKPATAFYGHQTVSISINSKPRTHFVHTLVLEAFCGPRPPGLECAHLNGNATDNRIENLKWCTPKENNSHKKAHGTHRSCENHQSAKYSADIIKGVRKMYDPKKRNSLAVANRFKMSQSYVIAIINRNVWAGLK